MKILFAVSNESISQQIVKKYESIYKEIVSSKNVYYFNAILKELQKDKSYNRIVVSEDLEPFSNNNYDITDNFIFEKLDRISDEAVYNSGEDIPIILIASDRRTAGENILNKLFGIGVYSVLLGQDRTIPKLCELINKPRTKKEAKIYYKIDSNETDYKPENDENVSELEIQNILTHYKKLGKNEEKYVESFNSIANQYTDQQLKVIIKFLPIGVKAVLEAKSPKYQQLAAFSSMESSALKNQKPYKSSQINPKTNKPRSTGQAVIDNGIKIESINSQTIKKPSKPVIIPGTVSTQNVKKIHTEKKINQNVFEEDKKEQIIENIENEVEEDNDNILPDLIENMENLVEDTKENENMEKNIIDENQERRRGRPKKVLTPEQLAEIEEKHRRGRGRPKKNNAQNITENNNNNDEIDDFDFDFDFDDLDNENKQEATLPRINNDNQSQIRIMDDEEKQEDDNLNNNIDEFEFEENLYNDNETEENTEINHTKNVQEEKEEFLPGFELDDDNLLSFDEPDTLPGFETMDDEKTNSQSNFVPTTRNEINKSMMEEKNTGSILEDNDIEDEVTENEENSTINTPIFNNKNSIEEKQIQQYDYSQNSTLSGLISSNKKVVAFVGTSKNGTSFLVNSLGDILSKQGIKTAILDLTKNKNDYYIYTKNEEELRKTATECMRRLAIGAAQGIKVNSNLDVYTSLPGDKFDESEKEFDKVLKTLIENYSLVVLDCDFNTDYGYLRESQEIYLVQSMDVLTIQPLTAFLRELKAKNVYEPEKLRIVINKYTRVRSVTERTIIGGMAFYNDPSMSFMSDELFDREKIRYSVIPFDIQTYSKYLEGIINCNISTNGYSKELGGALNKLAGMVYPLITGNALAKAKKNTKQNYNDYNSGISFSNEMNNTLDKMKNNF